jgi:predicted O-methyltransferase YrrM
MECCAALRRERVRLGLVKIDQVTTIVDGLPHMRKPAGTRIYDHVLEHELRRVLELGTYHGVSTCYLGAAVDEIDGHVTTIDRTTALDLEPNVNDLLERTGLTDRVTPIFAENSFTWELKRMLESADPPQFDFVFLDAGHTWDVTGFAFFLVDRLLRPGGWLLFDDLNWSVATSPSVSDAPWTEAMSQEERESRQIEAVFDLLVTGDERYDCHREGNWGWAQKGEVVWSQQLRRKAAEVSLRAVSRLRPASVQGAPRMNGLDSE